MGEAIFLRRAKKLIKDISGAIITLASGTLTYNGSTQTKQVASVVLDGKTLVEGVDYTVSGNTGKNAGNYTLTVTGVGDYEGSVTKLWSIAKATGSISVSPTTVDILGPAGTTSTATITYTGDGAISVASSATGVATVSRSGNTVTVSAVGTGSATITITLAAGTNYTGASCTVKATIKLVSSTLNANDWSIIKAVGAAGTGANYWSVGDRKAVAVNGTIEGLTLSGTYYVYILGINHNASIEGNGIHFMFGKTAVTGGKDIAFVDTAYGNSTADSSLKIFKMNTTLSNAGGWVSSYMNTTICPAFLKTLPSALQSAISVCVKYSDNTGGNRNSSSSVTASSSKIWLPAEFEVMGTRKYANSAEKNYQKRYDYYANGNSRVKYRSTSTSSTCAWWLRSSYSSQTKGFCQVYTDGNMGPTIPSANNSGGFAPCFKVA